MIHYVSHYLSHNDPDRSVRPPRRATDRRAARRTPHVAPRRRNVTTRSALLTGMLWRGALIDHGALISRGAFPFFEPDRRAIFPSGSQRPRFDPHRTAVRTLGSELLARFRGHRERLATA